MFTVIIYNVILIGVCMAMGVCALGGLYIMKCDEMTRENMGVKL